MKRILGSVAGLSLVGLLVGCPHIGQTECDFANCDAALGGPDGTLPDGDVPDTAIPDAKPDAPIPAGCDTPNEPLKNPEKCLTDVFGAYVSATGDDSGPGTKAKPFKTIGKALGGSTVRIVVCEGTYAESLDVKRDVELYSGVDCAFSKAAAKAKVVATKPEYAVGIAKPASSVRISEFEVEAVDGNAASANSVGIAVSEVAAVKLVGVDVVAKKGFDGPPGAGGTTGVVSNLAAIGGTPNGNPAIASTTPGSAKSCTCTVGGSSGGGGGGLPTGGGQDGIPASGATGKGGAGNISCNPTGFGGNGGDSAVATPASKQTTVGLIENGTWKGSAGLAGEDGKSGQGGGGGGGRDGSSAGGGGGCGGCGGSGGKGGAGAGGSIALLSISSGVALDKSTLKLSLIHISEPTRPY